MVPSQSPIIFDGDAFIAADEESNLFDSGKRARMGNSQLLIFGKSATAVRMTDLECI
jgi:hypothetical protein